MGKQARAHRPAHTLASRMSTDARAERGRGEHGRAAYEMTLDEELLLWLGDESAEVRAADAARVRDIAGEFAAGLLGARRRGRAR